MGIRAPSPRARPCQVVPASSSTIVHNLTQDPRGGIPLAGAVHLECNILCSVRVVGCERRKAVQTRGSTPCNTTRQGGETSSCRWAMITPYGLNISSSTLGWMSDRTVTTDSGRQ